MIPFTYPNFLNPFSDMSECKVYYLSSVSGMTAWTDYIPVKTTYSTSRVEGTTDALGYQAIHPLNSTTGLSAFSDYIPVYEDASKTVPWSTDATGYIPVGMSEDGAQAFLDTLTSAAAFDAALGVTSAGGFASAWADQSGNGRNLLQATGANQPIHLPVGTITSGTAAAGSTGTTLNLAASALAVNDVYNDMTVAITGGTGSGQSRTITDYVGATKIATVAAWSVTPDDTSTYTITATRASVFFDGAAHYMKCAAFTLNQPETVYLVAKQISWASTDCVYDGNALGGMLLQQFRAGGASVSPWIRMVATTSGPELSDMTVGANKVLVSVFNGASSTMQVNTGSVATGNIGAGNAGGFTLGAAGSNLLFSNIQAYEARIYSAAHDAATRANVIRALMSKHGVA